MTNIPKFEESDFRCPLCKSDNTARYIYGMPGDYQKLLRQQAAGKIIIAGCIYYIGAPHYHCNKCGKDW